MGRQAGPPRVYTYCLQHRQEEQRTFVSSCDYLAVCCLPVSRWHLLCSARPSLPSTHPPDCEHRPRHSLVAAPCKDKYTKPINTRRPGSRGGWGGRLQVTWKPGEEGMGGDGRWREKGEGVSAPRREQQAAGLRPRGQCYLPTQTRRPPCNNSDNKR